MKKAFLSLFFLLTGYVSFAQVSSNSFAARTNFSTSGPGNSHLSTGDIDGDGKKDIAAVNQTYGKINLFRNTSIPGTISFATRIDSAIGGHPTEVFLEDLDNDGRLDVISSTGPDSQVVVFRNISSGNGIALSNKQTFTIAGYYASAIGVADLDNDGKKDIVVADYSTTPSYTVLRNISTNGSVMFSIGSKISFSASYSKPTTLKLGDLDSDNKTDLVIFNENAAVAVFKNTTTGSAISFSTSIVALSVTSTAHKGDIADIDGDGKADIVVSNYSNSITSIFKNTSSSGNLSFATKVDLSASGNILNSVLRDLDEDGKPELIQTAGTAPSAAVSIYKNYCSPGTISVSSFGSRIDFSGNPQPNGIEVDDIDGDHKKDLIVSYWDSAFISVRKSKVISSNELVAHYPFSGNAGDSSGYENHGTKFSGVSQATDRKGQPNMAYSFDGSAAAYIQAPASASLNTANMTNFFVSAWINPASGATGQPNGTAWIFLQSNNTNYLLVYNLNTNKISFQNYNGTNFTLVTNLTSKDMLARDRWYHIAARIDSANKAALFINGILDTSAIFNPLKPISPTFTIGKNPSAGVANNWAFLGGIDDVKVYRRYVSDAEIAILSEKGTSYYSKATGNLNQLSTWGTNSDGSGISPLSFDSGNVTYYVRNNTNPALGGSWKIGGTKSTLVLGDGTNTFNLAVNTSDTLACDSIYINNSVTLTASGRVISTKLGSGVSATAQYIGNYSPQYIAGGTYTNLLLSGNGLTKILTGHTSVTDNLVLNTMLNTSGYDFLLGSNAISPGTLNRISGTINGKFSRWFPNATNSGASGLFPVGSLSKYAPFQVEFTVAPSVGGVVSAEFVNAAPANTGLPITDFSNGFIFIDKAAIDGYWKITSAINT